MSLRTIIPFAVCFLAGASALAQEPPASNQPPPSFGAVADQVMPSAVTIRIPRGGAGATMQAGSGVIVSAEGYILTTDRVLGNSATVEVLVAVGSEIRALMGRVITADRAADLAVIKVDGAGLRPASLADRSEIRAGDIAYVTDPHRSFTKVEIRSAGGSAPSGRGRGRGPDFIETDSAIGVLNAGSPLVDALGRVIGINVPSPRGEAIGLAIPIDLALPLIESVTQGPAAVAGPAAIPGPEAPRAFLGVQIADIPPAPTPPGIPAAPRGAVVQMVGGGSPAERAGVQVGDVIVSIDDQPVAEGARVRQILSSRAPGAEIAIEVLREGRPHRLRAVLTELPAEATAAAGVPPPSIPGSIPPTPALPLTPPAAPPDAAPAELLTGLTAVALTPEARARHAIPAEISGVLVTYISPTSRALAMGVQEGDVIMQVNRKAVTSGADARALAAQGDKTVLLKIYRKGDTMLFMVGRE